MTFLGCHGGGLGSPPLLFNVKRPSFSVLAGGGLPELLNVPPHLQLPLSENEGAERRRRRWVGCEATRWRPYGYAPPFARKLGALCEGPCACGAPLRRLLSPRTHRRDPDRDFTLSTRVSPRSSGPTPAKAGWPSYGAGDDPGLPGHGCKPCARAPRPAPLQRASRSTLVSGTDLRVRVSCAYCQGLFSQAATRPFTLA